MKYQLSTHTNDLQSMGVHKNQYHMTLVANFFFFFFSLSLGNLLPNSNVENQKVK